MRGKRWFGIGLTVLVLGAAAMGGIWMFLSAPLYSPGELAGRGDLHAARDTEHEEGGWQVEPGIVLAHESIGAGRNVLLVHGGPGIAPEGMAPAFQALAAEFRVHQYAQRGSGSSTRPFEDHAWSENTGENIALLEGRLGIGAQLADIERLRQRLGDEKLLLVGHSYGALLAALYAAEMPQRVEALVLIAPADLIVFPSQFEGFYDTVEARLPAERRGAFEAWKTSYFDVVGVFEHSTEELLAQDLQFVSFFQEAMGELPERPRAEAIGPWHVRAQFFSLGMRHDWSEFLGAIEAPTLIVHGGQDLQPIGVAEQYRDAIAGAELQTIEGSGHFPQSSHASQLASLLREHLSR